MMEKFLNNKKMNWFIVLLLSIFGVLGVMKVEADFSYKGYYAPTNSYMQNFDKFKTLFGDDSKLVLILDTDRDTIIQNKYISLIQSLTQKLVKHKDVERIDSITNYSFIESSDDVINIRPLLDGDNYSEESLKEISEKIRNDEDIVSYLVNKDLTATMLILNLKSRDVEDNSQLIFDMREAIAPYDKREDIKFFIAGDGAVTFSFSEISKRDLSVIMPLLAGLIVFLLWLSFKNIYFILISFFIIASTSLVTFGFAGFLGIKYSNIIAAIPVIIIAISLADAIHLLTSYSQAITKGANFREAILKACDKNLYPTMLTTLTTAVGFFSLAGADILPVKGLGILGGIAALFAWVFTYLFIGLILPYNKKKRANEDGAEYKKLLGLISHNVLAYPKRIILLLLSVSAIAFYFTFQNSVNSDPLIYLDENVPFRKATIFMDEKVGGASGVEIIINSEEIDGIKNPAFAKKVDELVSWMKLRKSYTQVVSYTNIIKRMNEVMNDNESDFYRIPDSENSIAQLLLFYEMGLADGKNLDHQITLDYKQTRVSGLWTLHGSKTILDEFDIIRDKIEELGLNGTISGKMPIYHSMNSQIVSVFFNSILTALLGIAVILICLFKSLRLGIISLIPNILPLGFGGMMLFLTGKPYDIGTVVVGAICLGVTVDDTIHFLTKYVSLKKQGYEPRAAVGEVFKTTGVALINTTLVLVLSFSSFLVADFVPNFNLGLGTIVILTMALIIDFFLLPSLLLVFDNSAQK